MITVSSNNMKASRVIAFFLAMLGGTLTAAEPVRKNVLFLIADDLNNYLGCYGDPRAKTPNIDRLAARGTRFQRSYCTFPLCGPSRNSLLTGLYPNSTGILGNSQIFRQTIPSQHSLSQSFRLAGYFAGRIGKLYHYNVPNSMGTNGHDDPASWELELNPAGVDRLEELPHVFTLTPGQFGGTLSWYASPKSDEHHTDALMAADAGWVLERCAKQGHRPLVLRGRQPNLAQTPTPQGRAGNPLFGYSLRTIRWRYTEWDEGRAGRELYDHETDPGEITNLAGKPDQAAVVEDLSSQIRSAVKNTFPADGKSPAFKDGLWAPNLTE